MMNRHLGVRKITTARCGGMSSEVVKKALERLFKASNVLTDPAIIFNLLPISLASSSAFQVLFFIPFFIFLNGPVNVHLL